MNYLKIYNNLINKGKNRQLEGCGELHHILPRCLGGTNEPYNLVKLTLEEHFLAHLLLVKVYPKSNSIVFAAHMMLNRTKNTRNTNKKYSELRRKFYKANKEKVVSIETRKKISESQIGKKASENTKTKMSESHKGKVLSKDHKNNLSKMQNERSKNGTHNLKGLSKQKVENGTHHWLNIKPWKSNRATENSIKVWLLAEEIIEKYKETGLRSVGLSNHFGFRSNKPFDNLIKKHESGWVPSNDPDWVKFKINKRI